MTTEGMPTRLVLRDHEPEQEPLKLGLHWVNEGLVQLRATRTGIVQPVAELRLTPEGLAIERITIDPGHAERLGINVGDRGYIAVFPQQWRLP